MNFKNLKIRFKLLLGFIAVTIVLALLGIISYHGLNTVGNQLKEVATNRLPSVTALHNIIEAQEAIKVAERDLLIIDYPAPKFREGEYKHIEDAWKRIEDNWKAYLSTEQSSEEKIAWDKFMISWNEWKTLHQKYLNLCKEEDKSLDTWGTTKDQKYLRIRTELNEKAMNSNNEIRPFFYRAESDLKSLIKINEDIAFALQTSSGKLIKTQNSLLLGFIAGGILLAMVIALFIASQIATPIKKIDMAAQKIAEGDLNVEISINSTDELGSLAGSFRNLVLANRLIVENAKKIATGDLTVVLTKRSDNDELMIALSLMVNRLNEIVAQVIESAANVASASTQFSSTTIQISQGANEQASSAEEISSSVEEMNSTIQQNSDNAIQTQIISTTSAKNIVDVSDSSQKSLDAILQIADKIKIINAIAEKTDILAINAAIEAARAGEHGKGFAVVATEVRKLAETSQRAAIEINTLSATSLKVTEEACALMMKIIPEVQKTATLVQEISAASAEQSSGSIQIAKAIEQLSQVTQQNSAAAEELSSTAEELASQAESLHEVVSFFNTGRKVKLNVNQIIQ